jgi:hypothetical protein
MLTIRFSMCTNTDISQFQRVDYTYLKSPILRLIRISPRPCKKLTKRNFGYVDSEVFKRSVGIDDCVARMF